MGKIVVKCMRAGCKRKRTYKIKHVHGTTVVEGLCSGHGGTEDGYQKESKPDTSAPHYSKS